MRVIASVGPLSALLAKNRNCAPLSAACKFGVLMQVGVLSANEMGDPSGVHCEPFQRFICTLKGGVPPKAMQRLAGWPASTVTSAGCCMMVGATGTVTVKTAGELMTRPAPLYTMTLYTAPLSATVSD